MPNQSLIGWILVEKGKKRASKPSFWDDQSEQCAFEIRLGGPFAGDKVVWRPGATHYYFNAGQMPGRHLVTVLVFLNLFVLNQVGYVNQHAAGIDLAAANVLIEGGKDLVDLDGKSARFGLPLTLADRLFPKLGQVLAAHGGGKFDLLQRVAQRTVFDEEFQMHLSLALELGHALHEALAIEPDGPTQGFIGVKHSTKAKGQHSGTLEAFAYYVGMLEQSFLPEIAGGNVLAYQYGKIPAGIRENLCVCYAF
jgi:hypothetical protein